MRQNNGKANRQPREEKQLSECCWPWDIMDILGQHGRKFMPYASQQVLVLTMLIPKWRTILRVSPSTPNSWPGKQPLFLSQNPVLCFFGAFCAPSVTQFITPATVTCFTLSVALPRDLSRSRKQWQACRKYKPQETLSASACSPFRYGLQMDPQFPQDHMVKCMVPRWGCYF